MQYRLSFKRMKKKLQTEFLFGVLHYQMIVTLFQQQHFSDEHMLTVINTCAIKINTAG